VLKTGVGYLSGNFPVYANPRVLDDPRKSAATADFLLRVQKAYAWANRNYPAYAAAQSAETKVPAADLIAIFNARSTDYSFGQIDTSVIASHQAVADAFQTLGVLDGPTDVAPFWDARFNQILQAGAAAL
jgi:sulfonate transport system substrate-binding protein